MVRTNKDITTQNNVKLSILLLQNGLSFCTKNNISQEIDNHEFIAKDEPLIFHQDFHSFDNIHLALVNNLNTFVPKSLFDADALETYLQYNIKVLKNDVLSFDELHTFDLVNVYVANDFNINWIQEIETTQKTHFATTLVSKLLEQNKNNTQLQFFVHFIDKSFQIIILQNNNLIFYNSFIYSSEIDVLYYILFVAEQFQLNPDDFLLILMGEIELESDIYKLIYQYVRNVSFYITKNSISHQHFVLNQL
jgi:hypothetical protein